MRYVQAAGAVKNFRTRFTNLSVAAVVAITGLGGGLPLFLSKTVFAITPITISNSTQLENAIENQADGQTWTIGPGHYALTPNNTITAGSQTGWYFPITANDITIKGVGNPIIYGDSYTADGAWATQDLVAIFGNNVTLKGLKLMPKVEPNKTIEVIGKHATIENVTVEPNTLTDPAEYSNPFDHSEDHWGGSIYYNNAGGMQILKNVTINNGGISDHAPGATLKLTNVHLNYATNVDWINGYRLATHGNSVSGAPIITYHVSTSLNNLDDVLTNLQNGDIISLDSSLTTYKQLTLDKSVTLNGHGHMLSPAFAKTDNSNNAGLGIQASNVTVNHLLENGAAGTSLHGINVFDATGVNLNYVTVKNNDYSGLNVDGSAVMVNNLTTAHNGWDGVDVDKTGAILTVNGTSHHTEMGPDIYVDDASIGQVVDTNGQYSVMHPFLRANDSAYNLKPAAPTLTYPDNNSYINTNDFWFDWNDVPGAASYEFQASQSPSTDGNGSLNSNVWTGDYQHHQPTASTLHSVGASGTWYWQVRTVNTKGAKSNWSAVWKMTIDMTAPAVPTITHPTPRQWFKSSPITDSWTAVTKDVNGNPEHVDHYQIAYNYDDGHSFGSSTCPSVTISGYSGFIGCRDVSGTSRNHMPGSSEEGGVTIWVRAVDAAGNIGAWSAPVHYYYDHSAPSTDITVTGLNTNNATNSTFTVEGDAHDNLSLNRVYVQLVRREDGARYGGTTINLIPNGINPVGVSAHWSHTYDISSLGLPDGTYAANVEVVDMAGNTFDPGWTANFTVDNTAPVVSLTVPANGSYLQGSSNPVVGSVQDANLLGYAVVLLDGNVNVSDFSTLSSGHLLGITFTSTGFQNQTIGNFDATSYSDGQYTLVLAAADQAYNYNWASSHFTIDTTAPVLGPITVTPNNNGTYTFSGTTDDPSSPLVIQLDGNTLSGVVLTGNDWSVTVPKPAAGHHNVTADSTDAAGNAATQVTAGFGVLGASTTSNTTSGSNTSPQGGTQTFHNFAVQNTSSTLGNNTANPQDTSNDTGNVKGDSTPTSNVGSTSSSKDTSTKNSKNFLGLGWWWLLVLAVILGFLWLVLGKSGSDDKKA
ncbi:MAG TPA: hypothetical protein VHD60_01550 [Candidatus Saccharimonadales bacterium]|nr:hypothetical protein [Candidatus Saccharimonadales bacterium]